MRKERYMKKLIAAVALGIGFVMFVIGLAAYLSPADYVSRSSIGVPGDQAVWLAIGGLLATGYVLVHKRMLESLRNMVELLRHHLTEGFAPHPTLNVQQEGTLRLPYGLAIAIGTFYCVGNAFWWR